MEAAGDERAIHKTNLDAFETEVEARLVDAVRSAGHARVSLVATLDERIVGHILFTPVTVARNPEEKRVWGLGPMSVAPRWQRRGIGSGLVDAGLVECRQRGVDAVVVLGHSEYYPRFGFELAGPLGLHFCDEEFDPYFMVREFRAGAVAALGGFVEYLPEFDVA